MRSIWIVIGVGLASLGALCLYPMLQVDSFSDAISKSRSGTMTQVNRAGKGLPFFTPETLNPIWDIDPTVADAVHIPATFKMVDQDGAPRTVAMFENKVSVVAFFFASCAGFCPVLMDSLKKIASKFEKQKGIQFIALTVDPEQDSVTNLKAYAKKLKIEKDSRWVLLTGVREEIYSLAKDTFASQAFQRAASSGSGRSFVHSEHLYVIDQKRRLRAVLNGTRLDTQEELKRIFSQLYETSENLK